jgi:hypothetical protein
MTRLAVFAYGSLVSRDSFRQTLGRRPAELIPHRLEGWRRRWSTLRDNLAAEKTFARHPDGELPRWIVGLNVERTEPANPAPAPNGALIEVSDGELERLDVRELRYERVDVSAELGGGHGFDSVFAYSARPDHFAARPPVDAVRMAPYLRVLEVAFTALGEGEWELFLQTTEDHPGETIEPQLVRDQIPPGNPREW